MKVDREVVWHQALPVPPSKGGYPFVDTVIETHLPTERLSGHDSFPPENEPEPAVDFFAAFLSCLESALKSISFNIQLSVHSQ